MAKKAYHTFYFLINDDSHRAVARLMPRSIRYHLRECNHMWVEDRPNVWSMKAIVRKLYDTSVLRHMEWIYGQANLDEWHAKVVFLMGVIPMTHRSTADTCFVACKICKPHLADPITYGAPQCCIYIFEGF